MLAEQLHIDGVGEAELIGRGGSGKVYRARQAHLDREVAVKIIPPGDETTQRRFVRERRAMGKLSDVDGIMPVYDSGITELGDLYLIMPFVTGGSLLDVAPMPWEAACELIEQVARSLARAHELGIVHRDIKPANILLTSEGKPLLADLGIAKLLSDTTHQTAGVVTLTPAYSPPECFDHTVGSAQGDIYSLAATLWHLIAGRAPFTEEGEPTTVGQLIGRVIGRAVGDLRPICPREVCAVIEAAMAKDPADRPRSADSFADALAAARRANPGWQPDDQAARVRGWRSEFEHATWTDEATTASGAVAVADRPEQTLLATELAGDAPSPSSARVVSAAVASMSAAAPTAPEATGLDDAAGPDGPGRGRRRLLVGAGIVTAIAAIVAAAVAFWPSSDPELAVPEIALLDLTSTSAHLSFDIDTCVVATWAIAATTGGGPADGGNITSNGYPSTDIECFFNNNYQPGIWTHPLRPETTYKGNVTISDGRGNLASAPIEFTTLPEALALPELTIDDITPTSARISFTSDPCVAYRFEILDENRTGPADTGLISSPGFPETSGGCFGEAEYRPGIETAPLTPGTTYLGTFAVWDARGNSNNGTFEFTTAGVTVPAESD